MRRRHTGSEPEATGPEAALEIAAKFLGSRPRSRWEVKRRLNQARVIEPIIEGTLEHLAKLGLVDDVAFARWWVEQRDRHAPRGRRLVEAELRQHGVGRDVIELMRDELAALAMGAPDSAGVLGAAGGDALPSSEEARARIALAHHQRGRPHPQDRLARQRLAMFLMRRGFDPETVRSALRAAEEEDTDSAG